MVGKIHLKRGPVFRGQVIWVSSAMRFGRTAMPRTRMCPEPWLRQRVPRDVWTWTALDSDSKMILSWEVGDQSTQTAIEFMDDLQKRLANRVQLTTDGNKAYLEAVEGALGGYINHAQLIKLYGETPGNNPGHRAMMKCIHQMKSTYG